jgi:hypothetical protein
MFRKSIEMDVLSEMADGIGAACHPQTIAVDFDGVIADYSHGYQGPDVFGMAVSGASDGMKSLQKNGWRIIIFTTRPDTPVLRAWLAANQIPYDAINETGPGSPKPLFDVMLDDRAYRFANWEQAMQQIAGTEGVTMVPPPMEKSLPHLHAPLLRIPKEFHPEGLYKAGDVEYEVIHEGDEAVLVKGGSFEDLFEVAADHWLVKSAMEELETFLEAK